MLSQQINNLKEAQSILYLYLAKMNISLNMNSTYMSPTLSDVFLSLIDQLRQV